MRRRPWPLWLFPLFLLGIAFSIPVPTWVSTQGDLKLVLDLLKPHEYLIMGLCALNALLLFQSSTLFLFLNPILGFLILYYSSWLTAGIFLLSHSCLLLPNVLQVLVNPEYRWWRRSRRKRVPVPLTVHPFVGESVKSHAYDISETGLFINNKKLAETIVNRPPFLSNDNVRLNLRLSELWSIQCMARIVRTVSEEDDGILPGVALEFTDFVEDGKKKLQRYLKSA